MKRAFLISLLTVAGYYGYGKTAVGFVVGLGSANASVTTTGSSVSTSYLSAPRAGLQLQQRVTPNFYIQTGGLYSVYGFRTSMATTGKAMDYKYTTMEVPLYLLAKTGMPCKPRVIVGVGLVGLAMIKNTMVYDNTPTEVPGQHGLNVGMGFCLGVEMPRGLFLTGNYQSVKNNDPSIATPYAMTRMYQYSINLGFLINKVSK